MPALKSLPWPKNNHLWKTAFYSPCCCFVHRFNLAAWASTNGCRPTLGSITQMSSRLGVSPIAKLTMARVVSYSLGSLWRLIPHPLQSRRQPRTTLIAVAISTPIPPTAHMLRSTIMLPLSLASVSRGPRAVMSMSTPLVIKSAPLLTSLSPPAPIPTPAHFIPTLQALFTTLPGKAGIPDINHSIGHPSSTFFIKLCSLPGDLRWHYWWIGLSEL